MNTLTINAPPTRSRSKRKTDAALGQENIPRADIARGGVERPKAGIAVAQNIPTITAQQTLMLVDDEENIIASLSRLLRRDGYTIVLANSGEQALALLARHPVGVIVTDQSMPKMSGAALLNQVKELYPDTVRIMLTGHADIQLAIDAINRGAIYKFLSKPWEDDALRASIAEAFVHYALVQQRANLARDIQIANDTLAQINAELELLVERKNTQLDHLANYDPLTNLPNRLLLLDRLDREIVRAQRDNKLVVVMYVDLDRFQQINDSFGHPVGDQLLQQVALKLSHYVKDEDSLARLGGDEFCFVLTGIKDAHDASNVAQSILDSFKKYSVTIEDNDIFITASIGISIYPFDGICTTTLMKNADAALYHAKSEGFNSFQYYTTQMSDMAWRRLTLETELRHAVEREEFVLYYQPKINLVSGRIIGVEALLRWQNTERGLVSPMEFIPLLEETGLIMNVGEWALRAASRQAQIWKAMGHDDIRVAVNLSALQFKQPDLAGMVQNICSEAGLDIGMGALELELTESLLMKNVEGTMVTLNKLHDMGVRLSIDDFGTGYSSLSYLKKFPIHSLKIDQSFVRDISTSKDDAAIVSAIVAMGHSLGLKVIAEGVETKAQLTYLRKIKCDEMQGYLFSRPVPGHEMTRLLHDKESLELSLEI